MKSISILGLLFFVATSIIATSCKDDLLEIQQAYAFNLTYLPIPSDITENGTVEIRCTLEVEGNYEGTSYQIRYFQNEGNGQLRLENQTPFIPNDSYELSEKEFRLYYTAQSKQNHQFDVYITDNFGQTKKVMFEFGTQSE